MNEISGQYATLKVPYRGYTRIFILEPVRYKWLVEICGSGYQTEFYEDEFDLDT